MASLKYIVLIVCVLLAAAACWFLYWPQATPQDMTTRTLTIGTQTVSVEVADTPSLREQGLSGRASLDEGKGMLFVFDEDSMPGFWMKDMRFSIDIIFIDAEGTVVTIIPNATPESYPEVFYPAAPIRYVLEVPAGFASRHSIAEGTKVVL